MTIVILASISQSHGSKNHYSIGVFPLRNGKTLVEYRFNLLFVISYQVFSVARVDTQLLGGKPRKINPPEKLATQIFKPIQWADEKTADEADCTHIIT